MCALLSKPICLQFLFPLWMFVLIAILSVVAAAFLIGFVIPTVILIIKNLFGTLLPPSFSVSFVMVIKWRGSIACLLLSCVSDNSQWPDREPQKSNQFVNELTMQCNKHLYSVIFLSFQWFLRARVASALSTNYLMTIIWLMRIQGKCPNLIRKCCILGGKICLMFYLLL